MQSSEAREIINLLEKIYNDIRRAANAAEISAHIASRNNGVNDFRFNTPFTDQIAHQAEMTKKDEPNDR